MGMLQGVFQVAHTFLKSEKVKEPSPGRFSPLSSIENTGKVLGAASKWL